MTKLTRGQRFYLVRLACGDGVKKPEPIRAFVARVAEETGFVIHPSELSEIENDSPSKAVTADHIEAVAAVDPKRRGRDWLGWDGPVAQAPETERDLAKLADPAVDEPSSPEKRARDDRIDAGKKLAKQQAEKTAARRKTV